MATYAVILIKFKIWSNGSNVPLYAFITFALLTPLVEIFSNFDLSFDWAHIEEIFFCIKIRVLTIRNDNNFDNICYYIFTRFIKNFKLLWVARRTVFTCA